MDGVAVNANAGEAELLALMRAGQAAAFRRPRGPITPQSWCQYFAARENAR